MFEELVALHNNNEKSVERFKTLIKEDYRRCLDIQKILLHYSRTSEAWLKF